MFLNTLTFLSCLYCSLLLHVYLTYAFNVDYNHPIIISNLVDGPEPESYFGASVQLLRKSDDVTWIIIGAPRSNSTYSKHANIYEPGTIWRCSYGKENEVCEVVMMDPTGEDVTELAVKDQKDGGWLGSALSGDESDRFVSCAGRWANQKFENHPRFPEYYLNGICYWRPKKDILEDAMPDLPTNYRLLPLSAKDNLHMQENFTWAYGQSGFSMHISNDNKLILGAPGIYNWRGSVIQYSDSKDPVRLARNGQPAQNSNIFSESLVVRPEHSKFLQNDSYFGYSVSSGKFFIEGEPEKKTQYVSGAPRGSFLMGQVVVFNFPKNETDKLDKLAVLEGTQIGSYFGSVLCVVDLNKDGFDDLIIGAPRFSSKRHQAKLRRFSGGFFEPSESLPLDATTTASPVEASDGNIFSSTGVKLGLTRGDEGAVFVYMSSGDSLDLKETLHGDNHAWGQFGTAISSPGDLNNDGYNDLVIGAPYSRGDVVRGGVGSIFIYHGTSKGVNMKYSQVIHASQIDSSLRGFGYSLSRGSDVDNNGYNDIAVGSYESGQVVLLRTRPSVFITGHVNASVTRLPLNATEFHVLSCVSFTGFNLPRSITVGVKISVDVDAKPPRVLLSKPEVNPASELIYEQLAFRDTEQCTKLNGVVVRPLESDLPVKIRQETYLTENGGSRKRKKRYAENPTKYDIRYAEGSAGRVKLDVSGARLNEFCSNCPVTNDQLQNTTVFSLPLEVLCGEDDKCTAGLRVKAFFEGIEPGTNFTIGIAPTVILVVGVKNFQETAMNPAVIISFTRRNLVRIPPSCRNIHVNSSLFYTYECSLGKMLLRDQDEGLSLEFDMSDLVAGGQAFEKEYIFHIEATTTSDMERPAALDLLLPVNATADVHISGTRDNVAFSPTTLATYQILSHTYDVRLHGISTIANMWLRFQIPVNLTFVDQRPGVEILHVFPPKAEVDGIEMFCTARSGVFERRTEYTSVNKNNEDVPDSTKSDPNLDAVLIQSSVLFGFSKSGSRRDLKKRDLTSENNDAPPPSAPRHKLVRGRTIFFECASEFVGCMEVLCKFKNFKASSRGSVIISMRIPTNVTRNLFEEDEADKIVIESRGEIELVNVDESIQLGNDKPDMSQASTTIKIDRPKRLSRWIYIGSIVGGILALICIIYGLYLCGVLDRKKPIVEDDVDNADLDDEDYEDDDEIGEDVPLNEIDEPDIASSPLEPIEEELEEIST